jgi:hypothetical protein
MGLFAHKRDDAVEAADPRHPHEYKAPASTWRIGCDISGLMPDDARHQVPKKQEDQESETGFYWPS